MKKWRGVACCCTRGPAILQLRPSQLSTNRRCGTCEFPMSCRKKIQLCILNSNFSDCCQGTVSCLVCFWGADEDSHDLDACGLLRKRRVGELVTVAPENLQYHKRHRKEQEMIKKGEKQSDAPYLGIIHTIPK